MVFNMPVNYLILNAFPFFLFGRIILYKGAKYKKKKGLSRKVDYRNHEQTPEY